jgi:formylglycine-generating enzyme
MKLSPFCSELVFVEGGTFLMGSNAKIQEQPIIQVTIPSFWIGKYLVTFDDFDYFCEETGREKPSQFDNVRQGYAVRTISWNDAQAHILWLSEKLNRAFRLPSESEWEFAARGGMLSKGFIYSGSNDLNEVGWYGANSDLSNHKVGQLKPNELGIYDMSGLQSEFCLDEWQNTLTSTPLDGSPVNVGKGTKKVLRNANYMLSKPFSCEVTRRYGISPKVQGSNYGYRIALSNS